MHRFGQKGPKDVAELEELRSWDHSLHFTRIRLGHGRKHACRKRRNMILLWPPWISFEQQKLTELICEKQTYKFV